MRIDANGAGSLALALPQDPALVGLAVVAQALDFSATDVPRGSHPAEFVIL